jgi:predicted RNA-binding Zn-ribbon protein involved in translation (DUF1610 family)
MKLRNKKTYKVACKCYNCGSKFLARSMDEAYYCYGDDVDPVLEIPLGTKIADVKCPNCGCQTLGGKYVEDL